MTTIEKVFFLKQVSLFSTLPGEEVAEIAVATEEVARATGEDVIREGDVDDSLFVIIAGKVRVVTTRQVLAALGERDVVGELALLDPAPRNATVTAATDVKLRRLDGEAFGEILRESHEIARGITRILVRRLRAAGAG